MKVHHRERAKGVDLRLIAFLDKWEVEGRFPILVLDGVRTDEIKQRHYFETGVSKAKTLAETAHGRAGALDVAPYLEGAIPWANDTLFLVMGEFAEAMGLTWGGRWKHFRDADHIQVDNWRMLPYPPPGFPD